MSDKTEHAETTWDLEGVYDDEIAPLMRQIIDICKREGLPMVATFQYANDHASDEGSLCSTALPIRPFESCETIVAANALIRRGGSPPAMEITTRSQDGSLLSSEVILP